MLDLVKSGVGLSLARDATAIAEAHAHALTIVEDVTVPTELSFVTLAAHKDETPAVLTSQQNDLLKRYVAAFEASPQSAESAMKAGLIDKTGYDDDALNAALAEAGAGAKAENFSTFAAKAEDRDRLDRSRARRLDHAVVHPGL